MKLRVAKYRPVVVWIREHGEAIWLAAIMVTALLLRTWKLGSIPPALFRDEAEKALNGWFLLHSGVDAVGRPWPLFIKVFGVTTSAIYQYAALPFLALGGLNEWTARLPSAVIGTATVALTWATVRRIWDGLTALWAAGFLAISPWHVPLSRWAQQGIFMPFFFTAAALGLANFLQAEKPKARWLALTGACVGLAMYSYDPARLFGPLLALAAAVLWWRVWVKQWRAVAVALASFAVCVSPVVWLMMNQGPAAMARFQFLSIAQPGLGTGEVVWQFVKNYASHFSPDYLLSTGDAELRHGAGVGIVSTPEIMLVVTTVVSLFMIRSRWAVFFMLWILLAPVPASLTREGLPHALRTQMALPAWQILAAIGLQISVYKEMEARQRKGLSQTGIYKSGRYLYFLVLMLAMISLDQVTFRYFGKYAEKSAPNWQYGVKQALEILDAPAAWDSTVVFQYIPGAEYLVGFYEKMDRAQYLAMLAGRSRYHIAPFDAPMENWLTDRPDGQRVVVTPPGVPHLPGSTNMFIYPPGERRQPPTLEIFLTMELRDKLKETYPD